jgi:hypothetical protein
MMSSLTQIRMFYLKCVNNYMSNKLPSFKEYHNDPEVIEEIVPALAGLGAGALRLSAAAGRGLVAAGKAALPIAKGVGNAVIGAAKGVGNALSMGADVASMGAGAVDIAKQQLASTAPGVPAAGYTREEPAEPKESMPQNMVKKMIPGIVNQVVAAAGEKNMKVAQQALKKAAQDIGKPAKPAGQL